jgi:putative membrane protein
MAITDMIEMKYVVASLLYSAIGLTIFVVTFVVLDLLTPKVSVWRELVEKQNIALAIFLGAVVYGIATIIASAIHG